MSNTIALATLGFHLFNTLQTTTIIIPERQEYHAFGKAWGYPSPALKRGAFRPSW